MSASAELVALADALEAEAARYRIAEPVHWRHLADATEQHATRVRRAAQAAADAASADRKAAERALDLAIVWETAEPHTLMSRRRAAAILREVLDQ